MFVLLSQPAHPPLDCRCLSPPSTGSGDFFYITVSVAGVPSTYLDGQWRYDAPVIFTVAPRQLTPIPHPDTPDFVVTGVNFGFAPGSVVVGPTLLNCSTWGNEVISCAPPSGVAPSADVVVTAASGQASTPNLLSRVSYAPPLLASVVAAPCDAPEAECASRDNATAISGTAGGGVLQVLGSSFAHPLPVTMWLTRGALPVPPWDGSIARNTPPPAGLGAVLPCPVVPGSVSETGLSCVMPPGAGVGWQLLLVNHDRGDPSVPGSLSGRFWQYSDLFPYLLHYRFPEVLTLEVRDWLRVRVGACGWGGSLHPPPPPLPFPPSPLLRYP